MHENISIEDLEKQILELKDKENIVYKYKYELLNIFHFNIKLYREIKDDEHPCVELLKKSKILLEKIDEKIKQMNENQMERRRRNIEKEITENKGIKKYRSKERNNPRKKYKKAAEKLEKKQQRTINHQRTLLNKLF